MITEGPLSITEIYRFIDVYKRQVLAEISPVPYQDLTEVLDGVEAAGRVPFVLILDRGTDVRNFGAIVRSAECAEMCIRDRT